MAFTESVCFRIKLRLILETAGEDVLRYTLLCGTDSKDPNVPLDEYLKNLPPSSTANFNKMIQQRIRKNPGRSGDISSVRETRIKSEFNSTDRSNIINDPSCATFDITLLHKAIKLACENVAEKDDQKWKTLSIEMEYLVTKIKDLRNEFMHEKKQMTKLEYLDHVREFKYLFSSALEATKMKYSRDNSEFTAKKDKVMKAVEAVTAEHLGIQEILHRSAGRLLPTFQREADRELKERLDSRKYLTPLHFLSGHEDRTVDVQTIYSKITFKEEQKDKKEVQYLKLLSLTQTASSPPSPHVMLVEGDPGSGKTTLLTFLLAEWLTDESCRQMEGLQHIDLLLWVVCREDTCLTLEELVKRALPDAYLKWENFLLPLLKKCQVLILIDGLDEQNNASRELVKDIMSQGKDCPTFTVICTSRPEGVSIMKARKPQNFMMSHVIIVGLSVEERTDFAVNYFRFLSSGGSTDKDVRRLKQVMQQIGWQEIFRLPLNVLFLAAIYYSVESDKLNTTLTQTDLYQYIDDWCVQKLLDRLARHPAVTNTTLLRLRVRVILRLFHEAALKGLLRDNIYLSDEDLQRLMTSCRDEELPGKELLSAFYCLRRDVIRGVTTEKFAAPHKGLQEFRAAQHIKQSLNNYKQGDIRRVLQDSSPGQELRLRPLRNLLSHLLGQMSLQDVPKEAMKESVELLAASGVWQTTTWINTLAATAAHPYAMECVANLIRSLCVDDDDTDSGEDIDDEVVVNEGTEHVAASLLALIPRKTIYLIFEVDPVGMDVLAPALAHHTVEKLALDHHFQHPEASGTSAHVLQQVPRSHLTWFMGHVEDLQCLQEGRLEELYLAVNNDHTAGTILAQLEHGRENFPQLERLYIHVSVSQVTPASLKQLPGGDGNIHVWLFLSGVNEGNMSKTCAIAATMCPREEGSRWISFPGASLGVDEYTRLFQDMKHSGMEVGEMVYVPDTSITEDEETQLNTLTEDLWGCRLERRSKGAYIW